MKNNPEKRVYARQSCQNECVLLDKIGRISSQIIDVSKKGVGVLVREQIPYKKGDTLHASIKVLDYYYSHAEVSWIKKDNGSTRVELNLLTSLDAI